jgi:hypothetical protein
MWTNALSSCTKEEAVPCLGISYRRSPPEDKPPPDEIRDDMPRRRPTLEPCLPPSGERAASRPERRQVLQRPDDFTFQ